MKHIYRLGVKSAKEDCEKLVTPSIVYINTNHESFKEDRRNGFMIFIGWWHWCIVFGRIHKTPIKELKSSLGILRDYIRNLAKK